MKLTQILFMVFCAVQLMAQFASIYDDYNGDPEKEWPTCQAPRDITVEKEGDLIQIRWDEDTQDYSYEYKLVEEYSRNIVAEDLVQQNRLTLDYSSLNSQEEHSLHVRRKCKDRMGNTIYSDWTVQAISNSGSETCTCFISFTSNNDLFFYRRDEDCMFIDLREYTCSIQPGYMFKVGFQTLEHGLVEYVFDDLTYTGFLPEEAVIDRSVIVTYGLPDDYNCSYARETVYESNTLDINDPVFDHTGCSSTDSASCTCSLDNVNASYEVDGNCLLVEISDQECQTGVDGHYRIEIIFDEPNETLTLNMFDSNILKYHLSEGQEVSAVFYYWIPSDNTSCSEVENMQENGVDSSLFDTADCTPDYYCQFNNYLVAFKQAGDAVVKFADLEPNQFYNFAQHLNEIKYNFSWSNGQYTDETFLFQNNWYSNITNWNHVLSPIGNATYVDVVMTYTLLNGQTFQCDPVRLDIYPESEICQILNGMTPHDMGNGRFNLNFQDDANGDNYFNDLLIELGLNSQLINDYWASKIIFMKCTFDETGEELSVVDFSNPMQDLNLVFSHVPIDSSFTSNVTVELLDKFGITHNCILGRYEFPLNQNHLPEIECGESYPDTDMSNTTMLNTLVVGDMVEMNGMTFIVSTVAGSNGSYSGEGYMNNPFTDAPIWVNFNGLGVNTDYIATSGTINGEIGDPSTYPDFNMPMDTLSIGGDICLPPPPPPGQNENGINTATGLDDRGFGPDSINVATGNRYDENGFDIEGNYLDTGSPYNEAGCDMNGLDSLGNFCEVNVTAVNEFIDSVSQNIDTNVSDIINQLTDTLNLVSLDSCTELRSEINDLINTLSFDPRFIIGENEEYLQVGMSQNFTSEPKTLVLNTVRDENVKLLEEKHVALYHCDKNYLIYKDMQEGLDGLTNEEIVALVNERMKELTPYQVDLFKSDPAEFQKWLRYILSQILQGSMDNSTGYVEPRSGNRNLDYSPYHSTAGFEDILLPRNTLEENSWLFSQGFQSINGVDRALYLEELHRQMMLNNTTGPGDSKPLPLKITKVVDAQDYNIYLDNLIITPTSSTINATFVYQEPDSGQRIIMKASNITFGPGGIQGESKLSLETPVEIRLNNATMLRINPGPATFVSWDCTGFTGMGVDLSIELCRDMVIPLQPDNQPIPAPARYAFDVTLQLSSWSDIYINFNEAAKPFMLADYPDMIWNISDVVLDFSDYTSPSNAVLPSGYISAHVSSNNALLPSWKGVYVKTLSVQLKSEFRENNQELVVGGEHLFFDDTGVSGDIFAENILPYEEGNLDGWQFSIEDFTLNVAQNHVRGGGMGGKINVPLLKNPMDYNALIYPNNYYEFTVLPNLTDSIDIYLAEVQLDQNSMIQVKKENDEFLASALLHGNITIDKTVAGLNLNYGNIRFDNLGLTNKSPYFSPGDWGFPNNISASIYGFGVNLSNLKQFSENDDPTITGISTNLDLNLVEALGISAGGSVDIIGELQFDEFNRQKWRYTDTRLNALAVEAEFSAGEIKGYINRFDDSVYGKGFQGLLSAKFKGLGDMTAMGLFGKAEANGSPYKYFFVDAKVNAAGLGIPAGPLTIKGFSGGVSYHMDRDNSNNNIYESTQTSALPPIGTTFSNTVYTPNILRGLGLNAGAAIEFTSSGSLFNGNVEFGMLFNAEQPDGSGGGLHSLDFLGQGQFMSTESIESPGDSTQNDNVKPNVDSSLAAWLKLGYNFTDDVFDGNFKVYLNTPGGLIRGTMNDAGKMVDASVYFSSERWYVYIGTPSNRCGAQLELPVVGAVKFDAYLDVGNDVPNMPPLPSNVREIAYKVHDNQTLRGTGAGFVFGASMNLSANMNFGIASGSLDAGLGFDLMVRNFPGAYCLGNDSDAELGINGWYSMGQMWAYLEGKIKILGINVLSAGVAAVLQAQLPNPTFAQATIGVNIKLLFKTVKKSFKVSLGESCHIVTGSDSSPLGMEVLLYMNPATGTKEMEIDASPQAILAIAPGEEYKMPVLNSDEEKSFKVELDSVSLVGQYGAYDHQIVRDSLGSVITIQSRDFYYDHDSITAFLSVKVYEDGEYIASERDSVSFTVGKGYQRLTQENIEYSYPSNGMHNFYKSEYNRYEGYIKLKKGMPQIFYNLEEGREVKMRLSSAGGEVYIFDLEYDPINRRVKYPLDPAILNNNTVYKLELINIEQGSYELYQPTGGNPNPDLSSMMGAISDFPSASGEPSSSASDNGVKVLYTSYFRVSSYDTYEAKHNAVFGDLNEDKTKREITGELFDTYETNLDQDEHAQIRFHAEYSHNWYNTLNNYLYKYNGADNLFLSSELNNQDLSVYCGEGVTIGGGFSGVQNVLGSSAGFSTSRLPVITKDEFVNSYALSEDESRDSETYQDLKYLVEQVGNGHYESAKNKVLGCLLRNSSEISGWLQGGSQERITGDDDIIFIENMDIVDPPHLDYIWKHNAPQNSGDSRKVRVKYVLPGGVATTSSFSLGFN